jgi:hypothetical protein
LETQELTPGHEVYNLVNTGKGEWIFLTFLVQACVVNTHSPFSIFLVQELDWLSSLGVGLL